MSLYGYKPKWKKRLDLRGKPVPVKPKKRIAVKRPERVKIDREFNQQSKAWLALPENEYCRACKPFQAILGLPKHPVRRAIEVHEKHGRGWCGELRLVKELWVPVCRECHDIIHNRQPNVARHIGLLAPKGQWNRMPS